MSFEMFHPVMFVSLGPGDPDLITVKGLKVLQDADIIICPSTQNAAKAVSRAMDILSALEIDRQKIAPFGVPMSKDRTKAIDVYRTISEKIAKYYKSGLKIAVTAEGDAGFYSSVHYINDNLTSHNIPVERVGGVPAFIACGALANIHIVKQEEELIVIPGVTTRDKIIQYINESKKIVVMKPSQSEDIIKDILFDIPALSFYYFENAGVSDKEFYTDDKEQIIHRKFPYFSLLIIQPENNL